MTVHYVKTSFQSICNRLSDNVLRDFIQVLFPQSSRTFKYKRNIISVRSRNIENRKVEFELGPVVSPAGTVSLIQPNVQNDTAMNYMLKAL